MSKHPVHRRFALLVVLAGAVVLSGTACEPLINPPPGGGEIVTQTFRYGPFTLGPGGEQQGFPTSGMPRPTGSFGLKTAKFDLVDAAGNPVSVHDVHLHHIVMFTSARQDRLCSNWPERFMGSGMERTPLSLLKPYAYLVGASDPWGSVWHLMNETGTSKTVYIQYTLGYQPAANATNSRPVQPLFQDITGCGASTYDVPGDGGIHVKSKSWPITQDGIVVASGGHVHMGGIDITLSNGIWACTSYAMYEHEPAHHLSKITPCPLHDRVRPGQNFSVTARYENWQPLTDVMGIMLTYVWWGTQQ
jgi:hypothetical protein